MVHHYACIAVGSDFYNQLLDVGVLGTPDDPWENQDNFFVPIFGHTNVVAYIASFRTSVLDSVIIRL
jgi:hypothetical protein